MGFTEDVSVIAAQKYGQNIEGAIAFISSQPSSEPSASKPASASQMNDEKAINPTPKSSSCIDHIHILRLSSDLDVIYDNTDGDEMIDKDKNDIYDIVSSYYENKGRLKQFCRDYHEFINNMDDEEQRSDISERSNHICNVKDCRAITRNWGIKKYSIMIIKEDFYYIIIHAMKIQLLFSKQWIYFIYHIII